MTKGKLIVFEGIDKSGKETQSSMLDSYLQNKGYEVEIFDFPDYETASGITIQRYLRGGPKQHLSQKTINLMYSANRYEKKESIEYYLNRGDIVICDRYYYSNMAYGSDSENPMKEIMEMDSEMPKPDLVIYIDILPETSMKRSGKDPDKNESDYNLLYKAYQNYEKIKSMNIAPIVPIPGFTSIEDLHKDIVRIVENKLFKK